MLLDFENPDPSGDVLTFPDFPFAGLPRTVIVETIHIEGASGDGVSIPATPDQEE